MLIDPLTCFAAIKSGMSLLERGIKAGKDLHELGSYYEMGVQASSQNTRK